MTRFATWRHRLARLRAWLSSGRLDRELHEELASHLAMLTEDNVRRGMTPEAARRAAALRTGSLQSLAIRHRDVRGLPSLDSLLQDVRFAGRLLVKDRWASMTAIVALALGIGANTIGFAIVHGAFLRALPFDHPEQVLTLSWQNRAGRRTTVSAAELEAWRGRNHSFEALAAYRAESLNVSDDRATPDQVRGARVTANLFAVLRQAPLAGRDFVIGDERPGADAVAIISARLWKTRYGGDDATLGRVLRVDGQPTTIVGIMPEEMGLPNRADVWVPFIPTGSQQDVRQLIVFGRARSDIDRRQAQAELNNIGQQMIAATPAASADLVGVRVETFTARFMGGAGRTMFQAIMGAVVFVLLIACANVANLLLSRSAGRAREIAVRMAAGATRWRIVRQLLVESLVLSAIGGALGLLLAQTGIRVFATAMQGGGLPYWVTFAIDYNVFAYVAAICVATTVIFGLAPALHVSRTNCNEVLKDGGRGSTGARAHRFSSAIVVAELALTMVLLVGAGLLARSFLSLYATDLGIDSERLMAMRVELPEARYADVAARRAFFDQLEPRLAAIPGVDAAAVTTGVPPFDERERLLEIDSPRAQRPLFVGTVAVTPRFFEVVGVALRRGRTFTARDGLPGAETVIVNELLAAKFFPGEDPIGRRLRFTERDRQPAQPVDVWRTIVGISPPIKHGSPQDGYENAVVYLPYREAAASSASLLVRSGGAPGAIADAVRREVQTLDRDQPVQTIQTIAQLLEGDRWWYRTFGGMFAAFAVVALFLSAVGISALMAYSVAQRTQEIGVRLAVGAQRHQVSWLVLARGLKQLALGLALGTAGALAFSRVLQGSLVTIEPWDPVTFAAIALLLTVVAIGACLLPARRATRVDPVVALRAE